MFLRSPRCCRCSARAHCLRCTPPPRHFSLGTPLPSLVPRVSALSGCPFPITPPRVLVPLISIMARKSLMAAAAALAVLAVSTVAAAKDEAVVSLTEKSFAETIAKEALVLVKFTVRLCRGWDRVGALG